MRRKLGMALAITAFAFLMATVEAKALSDRDILGSWCSATARLTFTRGTMTTLLFSDKSEVSRRIKNYEFGAGAVTVYWYKDKNELTSSDFSEFSADGRRMFLQPDAKFNVPRREYNRC
jgi:hypothetical protein